MPTIYSTDFSGADLNPIGAPWVSLALPGGGNVQRLSSKCYGVQVGRNTVYIDQDAGADQTVEVRVGSLGTTLGGLICGPIVGITPETGTCWLTCIDDSSTVYLVRVLDAGGGSPNFLTVTTVGHTHAPGDLYSVRAVRNGNNVDFTISVNGGVVSNVSDTDNSIPFGSRVGMLIRNTDAEALSFLATTPTVGYGAPWLRM